MTARSRLLRGWSAQAWRWVLQALEVMAGLDLTGQFTGGWPPQYSDIPVEWAYCATIAVPHAWWTLDPAWLACRLRRQDRVVLALDGVPHEADQPLWVLRDVLSGTVFLVRSSMRARGADMEALIGEVAAAVPVPITAVIYSGPGTSGAGYECSCR